ncbi:hypothetical protein [Mycolicibacterium hippocampi]|nr:hypothetical protein [Mycolicibacterium hippocampi]
MDTSTFEGDRNLLLLAVDESLGVPRHNELAPEPRGYPDSLALCLIDSVQSLRNGYGAIVVPVLKKYAAYRTREGADAYTDGLTEFLAALDEMGGVEQWTSTVGTRHKAPGTSVLKGEAMQRAAEALLAINIDNTSDLGA